MTKYTNEVDIHAPVKFVIVTHATELKSDKTIVNVYGPFDNRNDAVREAHNIFEHSDSDGWLVNSTVRKLHSLKVAE